MLPTKWTVYTSTNPAGDAWAELREMAGPAVTAMVALKIFHGAIKFGKRDYRCESGTLRGFYVETPGPTYSGLYASCVQRGVETGVVLILFAGRRVRRDPLRKACQRFGHLRSHTPNVEYF